MRAKRRTGRARPWVKTSRLTWISGKPRHDDRTVTIDGVDLYWIPLGAGAGGAFVRFSGRLYEAVAAALARRPRCPLFHSALEVTVSGVTTVVEMAPVWIKRGERGVVSEGPVGARFLGRSRLFRYEVRCWHGGSIPDLAAAVGGPITVSSDSTAAQSILDLVPKFPCIRGDATNSARVTCGTRTLLCRGSSHVSGSTPETFVRHSVAEPPVGMRDSWPRLATKSDVKLTSTKLQKRRWSEARAWSHHRLCGGQRTRWDTTDTCKAVRV
jgi:hypothetical protein